jgi:predicted RNase H-like HicB family nuclease
MQIFIIEHDESGYYAFAPELPGCHSQGDTFEEARSNVAEAITLYLSTLDEEDRSELSVLIPEEEEDEKRNIMKISEAVFDEWDNDTDSIYDAL